MLRIGKLTDYATVVLAAQRKSRRGIVPPRNLPSARVSAGPTVSKVLKRLAAGRHGGFLARLAGGYRLARAPEQITAAHILDAFEGPIAITECSGASSQCGIEHQCRVGGAWQRVNAGDSPRPGGRDAAQLAGLDAVGCASRSALEFGASAYAQASARRS